jgi:magnesium transporter
MRKRSKNISKSVGQSPGALIYTGDKPVTDVIITIIEYNAKDYRKSVAKTLDECVACKFSKDISWINIDGVHNIEIIKTLGEQFNLHPLLLEDVLDTQIRPKIEFFDHYVFIVLKMLRYNKTTLEVEAEQVSMVMGDTYVISLQEDREGDVFDPIRNRLESAGGRTRRSDADFLFYSLIDTVVDNYFLVLEKIGERVEALEDEITNEPTDDTLKKLYKLKQELIFIRKSVWPLREVISSLEREETPLIRKETRKYIRDAYDHTIQVIDTTESYRDSMGSLLDIYLSSISNRTNDVVKVLTIISTIFMPLTFIAGVYGMNFDYMPELRWKYSYFVVLGLMLLSALAMLMWFRRKKWI